MKIHSYIMLKVHQKNTSRLFKRVHYGIGNCTVFYVYHVLLKKKKIKINLRTDIYSFLNISIVRNKHFFFFPGLPCCYSNYLITSLTQFSLLFQFYKRYVSFYFYSRLNALKTYNCSAQTNFHDIYVIRFFKYLYVNYILCKK